MPTFLRIFKRRLASLAGFALGMLIVSLIGVSTLQAATADRPIAPPAPTRAQELIEAHDCWTGAAPADMEGVLPGHVVATRAGRQAVHSRRLVGPALDQLFAEPTERTRTLVVHAFCR